MIPSFPASSRRDRKIGAVALGPMSAAESENIRSDKPYERPSVCSPSLDVINTHGEMIVPSIHATISLWFLRRQRNQIVTAAGDCGEPLREDTNNYINITILHINLQ